jgi:lipoprotein-anchoring transpeptidase ErfK/SrfK
LNVAESLYNAHYQLGVAKQEAGDLLGAQESFQAAIEIIPERLKARHKAEEIAWLLVPPTPTATPTITPTMTPTTTPTPTATPTPDPSHQRIVVDISEQQMYVYLDEKLLWQWTVSTGEPGKDTATGSFAVLSKIDNAYGSTWDLDMPHWLGIYRSGPLENGIHGLPVQRATGSKLWEGLLGQRVSYGCIILNDENAQTLYDWAHIGTPVIVQW